MKFTVLFLLLGPAVLTGVQAVCHTTTEGYTWNFQGGRDEVLYDVASPEDCLTLCFGSLDCAGYTWTSDQVVDTCYLFQHLEDIHECHGCNSGAAPNQSKGDFFNGGPEMAVVSAETAMDCFQACADTEGCVGYTWFDQASQLPNPCYMYSDCSSTGSCDRCTSGILNCIVHLPIPVPDQCTNYQVLDDPTRNRNHEEEYYCDFEGFSTSPDWKGAAYYRVQEPAGVRIPTGGVSYMHCGTSGAGWINDYENKIPNMKVGEEVTVRVCYSWLYDQCDEKNDIKVTKCPGDYLVYYLVTPPVCNLRYCAEF